MQRSSHPASTLKQRLRTSMRTWGNDVTRFPRCFFTQVRRLRGRPPAATRQLCVLAAASQPRRSPRSPSPSPAPAIPELRTSRSTQRVQPDSATQSAGEILVAVAADRLAIAGALATAQAAKVMRSVGLDADEVEQVGVVDVAKVKQSAVGDAVELQDSAVVDVSDETAADNNSDTTMTAKTLRV
ncbi:hypothetical protein PI124_g20264 [Phytophthora idaei]|nr:hypothetical protein PI125_g21203 [Phytophthora idaei]KAG3132561.1 hypothetical protein PI126_g19586 [Phytophthora idaei]KAG3234683.1 hypothetical protein PI124_g20264 [Phytophthora idaei]